MLTAGGVVLPSVHRASHAFETPEERADHAAHHHGHEGHHHGHEAAHHDCETPGDRATEPEAPHAHGDCTVCTVTLTASETTAADSGIGADPPAVGAAPAERVVTVAAFGAGARAPPVG